MCADRLSASSRKSIPSLIESACALHKSSEVVLSVNPPQRQQVAVGPVKTCFDGDRALVTGRPDRARDAIVKVAIRVTEQIGVAAEHRLNALS